MADLIAYLLPPAQVLWVLTPTYIANAGATLPRGRGPPMDFGRVWRWDGRRLLGPSKTWAGFWFGTFFALPFGLLQAYLILIAPPNLAVVPQFAPSVLAAIPVVLTLSGGALLGDAIGSFLKRRLNMPSGKRALLLDQLPFVVVPILLGSLIFPSLFVPTFWNPVAVFWVLFFTLGLHTLFNWIGYHLGTKTVPW